VTLRRHLDGTYTVWRGPILWSRYDITRKRTHHVSNQPVTFTCQQHRAAPICGQATDHGMVGSYPITVPHVHVDP
jgi:hypothetical protein